MEQLYTELSAADIKRKRGYYLGLSALALLFLGLLYAFSMFSKPMVAAFGLEGQNIGLSFYIMMICFCLGTLLCSLLIKRIGLRGVLFLSALLFLAGFAGTGLLAKGSIWAVYLLYAVCGGLGVGFGYNAIVSSTNMWFPDKLGICSGVLMLGFGISSLVCGTAAVKLYEAGVPLSAVFIGIGLITCIITLTLAFVLKKAPADIAGILMPDAAAGKAAGEAAVDKERALGTPIFYVFWFWLVLATAIGLAIIGSAAADAVSCGVSAGFATLLVGLVSSCNGLGRLAIGAIFDRKGIGFSLCFESMLLLLAVGIILMGMVFELGVLYIVGALLVGFCYGGVPVLNSAFTRRRFGAKNFARNFACMTCSMIASSLLNIAVTSLCGDSRVAVFVTMLLFAAAAVALLPAFLRMYKKDCARLGL